MDEHMEGRLRAIETDQRRFKWYAGGLCLGLVLLAGEGVLAQKNRRVLEAERFVVRDPSGKVRAELGVGRSGTPSLTLRDAKGRPQASLEAEHDSSAALTLHERGQPRLQIDSASDGSSALRIYSRDEETVLDAGMRGDGSSSFSVQRGKASVTAGVSTRSGAELKVSDPKGVNIGWIGEPPPAVSVPGA